MLFFSKCSGSSYVNVPLFTVHRESDEHLKFELLPDLGRGGPWPSDNQRAFVRWLQVGLTAGFTDYTCTIDRKLDDAQLLGLRDPLGPTSP